ncbi:hypothetical protein PM082_003891 [Marasmius tenuissimus]|nr:hypothetical protein PM082_003891 [Marasmius tenuissimus]
MSSALDLVFGIEHAAPNAIEDIVDEYEAPQETDGIEEDKEEEKQKPKKRWKRPSAYVTVFEEITNEICDHELELLDPDERNVLGAFSQLSYPSRYTLTRLLQRNPGQWHPLTSMEKFRKEISELDGLVKSVESLCTQSATHLLSLADKSPTQTQSSQQSVQSQVTPVEVITVHSSQPEIIDLTMDSDDEGLAPINLPPSASTEPNNDSTITEFFFCDDDSKMTLDEALRRLSVEHLQALAKDFKCNKPKTTKDALVTSLLDHARGQAVLNPATFDRKGKGKANATPKKDSLKQTTLFGNGFVQKKNQEQLLLTKARDKLGTCVRINPSFHELIVRMNIIYYRSTEMPPKPFTPSLLTVFKKRAYPQYTHNRSVIWPARNEFLEYEKALQLQLMMSEAELAEIAEATAPEKQKKKPSSSKTEKEKEVVEATESKAAKRSRLVLDIFRREKVEELWDRCCDVEKAKPEDERRAALERFQCGHILTRLMSKAADACGPLKEYNEEFRLLQKLLNQKFWRRGKRADWYIRRALIMDCYLSKIVPKKPDRDILRRALKGIEEALEDTDTHLVSRPDLVRRYQKLEKTLRIPEHSRCKVYRELREPVKVEYAGHRMWTTQSSSTTTTVNSPAAGASTSSTAAEKENIANDNTNQHGMPINAELTSYFRKVPVPYDPDKEEVTMLIANATTKAQWKWKGKSKWRGEGGGEVTVEELALQFYAKRGFKGLHSETSILTTIFALLFWDVIFADIPGAFETKFQAGPLDLAEDSFYYARKDLIDRRIQDIEAGHARRLVEKHDKMYRGQNTLCVGVRWDVCPPEDLLEAVECLKNDTLVCICRLFCEDYAARARGVPDLFVWNYDKRECMFVEVKGPGDRPSETQKLWFDTLLNARADVEICRIIELTFKGVNSKKRKKENRKKGAEKETLQEDVPVRGDDEESEPESEDGEEAVVEVAHRRTRSRSVTLVDGDGEERDYRVVESPQKKRKTTIS